MRLNAHATDSCIENLQPCCAASAPPTATPQGSQQPPHWPTPVATQPIDGGDGAAANVAAAVAATVAGGMGSRSSSRHTSFSAKQRPTLYANSLPTSNDVSFVGPKPGVGTANISATQSIAASGQSE